MKSSLKIKTFIAYIIVIFLCIAVIIIFNTLFLESFYIRDKVNIIKKTHIVLDNGVLAAYDKGYDLEDLFKINNENKTTEENSFITFIREIQESYNASITLFDENNKAYSLFHNNMRFNQRAFSYLFKDAVNDNDLNIIESNENYTIAINNHEYDYRKENSNFREGPREYFEHPGPGENNDTKNNKRRLSFFSNTNKNSDIECFGLLSDGSTAFFIVIPISSIKEPIALFNKVILLISITIIIVGAFIIYFVADYITKPILQLSKISKKMSKMEFEYKYDGNRKDEIGILGDSINEMSAKLEKTIKELKNANYNLKKDLEQKVKLDKMRQEFVANVSHELKTPIALIQGYVEGLEDDTITSNEETKKYYLDVIKDEAMKMNRMVHDLLNLSELEMNSRNEEIQRHNLLSFVEGAIKSQDIITKQKNLKVDVDIDANCYVWINEDRLEDVIRNYYTNAIKYVDDNKYIKFFIKKQKDDCIRFYVFNTATKLSDDEKIKIWDKFYKIDESHSRELGGTGLGLSIVKAIARQYGLECGCIDFKISEYYGIAFYFDFIIK